MAAEMKQGDAGERARATRAEEGKGNGAEVLGASALLDPYTWERPLDSVHRVRPPRGPCPARALTRVARSFAALSSLGRDECQSDLG